MNATGLNIIKALGCMAAVTFFTLYNTWDNYDYDYHWIVGLLTFVSTIATPLFFVVAGYLDAQSKHHTRWQLHKIKNVIIVFLFWMSVYALWEPYQRGYLIQPWFVFTFIIIYAFHTLIDRLSQQRRLFLGVIFFLLLFSYGYDLLAAIFPGVHFFGLQPQYRLWTWLLFYLTGLLFNDPLAASWFSRDNVVKAVTLSIPFIYLFTWFYERHFFFALFKTDKNAFILTGSQIYLLVVALVIAANGVRFRRHIEIKERLLATLSKAMTGVYILHYSIFHLLTSFIIINSLATKLALIFVTFIISVFISILALSNSVTKKLITL